MTLLSCPKCSKAFSKPSHLQRHAQSHSHDRAFGCELCGKRFTREDSKARHIRRLHKTDNVIFSSAERSSHTAADTATRATPSQSSDIEETEGVSSQLHPGTGTTPSYAAHQNSVADPLDRPYKALDEDAARLLVAQENEGENDTLSGIHQTILQANPTTFGAIYDASMSGMLALDSAAQVMNAADGESADYGISSHGDGAINGAFGLEGQQNQLWQDAPTWEAALESDTFFDSWLQYDPSNSLAGSASKPFALFSDLSQSQRDLSACTQSFPQQPNTMYTTAQMRQDISAPAVPASPRTTTFWSQWLQAESAHTCELDCPDRQ